MSVAAFFPQMNYYYRGTGSYCVVQAGLGLATLLPQPPECWDFRREPPHRLATSLHWNPCMPSLGGSLLLPRMLACTSGRTMVGGWGFWGALCM